MDDVAPIAANFSPNGNYLQVDMGEEQFYLELATGERLSTGFMSPDEHWLATLPTEENFYGELCDLLIENCYSANWPFADFIWLNNDEVVVWAFGEGIGQPATRRLYSVDPRVYDTFGELCRSGTAVFPEPDERDDLPWFFGVAFDYEPTSQMIVVQNDSHTISVGYHLLSWKNAKQYTLRNAELTQAVCNDYVTFDLADNIDGEIVSVEWLPSIFIEE